MKRSGVWSVAVSVALMAGLTWMGAVRGQADPAAGTPPVARGARGAAAPTVAAPAEGAIPAGTPSRGGRGQTFGVAAATRPAAVGEGPTCPLDATVYDVRLAMDQIARVDIDKLTKAAATPAGFEKALAELGAARPLYHVNQMMRLGNEDYAQVGAQVPYVTNSQITNTGQTINSVAYSNVGAIFDMVGKVKGGNIDLDLSIQVSVMSDGGVKISDQVVAPYFRIAQLQTKTLAKPKQPFVVLSIDAATPDPQGKAIALVTRMVLGTPEEAGAK